MKNAPLLNPDGTRKWKYRSRPGHYQRCKELGQPWTKRQAKYMAVWRKKNPGKQEQYYKKSYNNNKDKWLDSHARWAKKNREKIKAYRRAHRSEYNQHTQRWAKANPEKVRAHQKAGIARKRGIVKRPDRCSACGIKCVPHGHHSDYSKPLAIKWVCRFCHWKIHFHRKRA